MPHICNYNASTRITHTWYCAEAKTIMWMFWLLAQTSDTAVYMSALSEFLSFSFSPARYLIIWIKEQKKPQRPIFVCVPVLVLVFVCRRIKKNQFEHTHSCGCRAAILECKRIAYTLFSDHPSISTTSTSIYECISRASNRKYDSKCTHILEYWRLICIYSIHLHYYYHLEYALRLTNDIVDRPSQID